MIALLTGCGSNLATDCELSGLLQLAKAASVAPAARAELLAPAKLSAPLSHPSQISPAAHLPGCSCPLPPLPPLSSAAGPFLPVLPLGGEHGISRPAAEPAHSLIHCRTMDQTSAAPVSTFSNFFPPTSTRPCFHSIIGPSRLLACSWHSPLDELMDEWKCEC